MAKEIILFEKSNCDIMKINWKSRLLNKWKKKNFIQQLSKFDWLILMFINICRVIWACNVLINQIFFIILLRNYVIILNYSIILDAQVEKRNYLLRNSGFFACLHLLRHVVLQNSHSPENPSPCVNDYDSVLQQFNVVMKLKTFSI